MCEIHSIISRVSVIHAGLGRNEETLEGILLRRWGEVPIHISPIRIRKNISEIEA
jgi:hypothetical protein